jgi:CHAD domain-containing protein
LEVAVIENSLSNRVMRTVEDLSQRRETRVAAGAATVAAAAAAAKRLVDGSRNGGRSGVSREYRLRRREPLAYGVRRVARGRLESAVERLRADDVDEVNAIHDARKDLKKLRSALRMVRPVLGDDTYQRENERYRDAARRLSAARDEQALEETIDALAERFADEAPPGGWPAIREAVAPPNAATDDGLADLRAATAAEIETGRREIDTLALPGDGFDVVEPGLRRAYSRGRRRFAEAAARPTDEALHEWRKRAKDLWYHQRLLRPLWDEAMSEQADHTHKLSELLGDGNDLAVLREKLAAPELVEVIETRIAELRAETWPLGRRIYAEKPKAFDRRLKQWYRTWEAEKASAQLTAAAS